MNKNITVTVNPEDEGNQALIKNLAVAELARLGVSARESDITELVFRKKSIDARRGRVKIHLMFEAWIGESPSVIGPEAAFAPAWKKADTSRRVVVVGSGPAGLFAALRLLESGVTPIVVERGVPASDRKRDIADISREGKINPDSNYCFGEGGAGTFSDGKLYTRSNKRGDIGRILAIFNHHGANDAILTDAHPHIGSDRLPAIIGKMRETIVSWGGEVRFGVRCASIAVKQGPTGPRAAGIVTASGETISADAVILATGHSARDVYEMIAELDSGRAADAPRALEAKTFAMGVRVEHPRELIDKIQYHGQERNDTLPAAEYRLVAQSEGRGVYSFCMCPGGLIVPSATEDSGIVINGMSPSSRNTRWSNAAIVVETRPEDVPAEFRKLRDGQDDALAGLRFRTWVEEEAKKQGDGQKAPAQRLEDFLAGKDSTTLPECSYSPGIVASRLDRWLPEQIRDRLAEAFVDFDKNMKGFVCKEAVLVAPETRTSSPVRILRDPKTLESPAIAGLYPAGEGAGYAGGIVSSAMDGERCADAIVATFAARRE